MRGVFGRCLFHSVFRNLCMNKIDMEMFELCVCGVSIGCLFQACKETLEQDEPPTSSRKKSCPLVLGSVQV